MSFRDVRTMWRDKLSSHIERLSRYRYIWTLTVVFLAYVVGAWIGAATRPPGVFAAMIWPSTGIALAALFIYGYRVWPAVALAAFVACIFGGVGIIGAFFIAVGNTVEPLIGVYALKEYVKFDPPTPRLRDNAGLAIVALVVPVISATVALIGLWINGSVPTGMAGETWGTWWLGDSLGILVVAPFLGKWLLREIYHRTRAQFFETYIMLIVTAATAFLVFWTPPSQFEYYLFIPLTWAALRTGPRGVTLATVVAVGIAISGTLQGFGPLAGQGPLFLQLYIGTLCTLFLIFSAIVEDLRVTHLRLQDHIDDLGRTIFKLSSEDEAKKEFLAVLAHELRNPLAAILSSAELLKIEGPNAPDAPTYLDAIDDRARAMTNLLDDLLDVSRITHKKMKLRKQTCSLNVIIDRSVLTSQAAMQKHHHTLTVTKPPEEIFLNADQMRLEQIFVNLLNNAAKFTEKNGRIKLVASREEGMAVIKVIDTGIGIPRAMLKRIFEPFFQVDHGKVTTEGLGIGLSLTRQLVELHGGFIDVVSGGEGRGSEFIVKLPLLNIIPAIPTDRKTLHGGRTLRQAKNTLRILVVDDNEAAANATARLLELRGHTIAVARSGHEAIEKEHEFHPDVAIIDIGLPDIDGYEVARTLRAREDSSCYLIALTGYGQEEDKEAALRAGFDRHLTKPVGLKEIEAVLRKIPHATPAGGASAVAKETPRPR